MSLNLVKPALWLNCFAYAYAFKLVIKLTIQEASDIILDFFWISTEFVSASKVFYVNILTMPWNTADCGVLFSRYKSDYAK